MTDYRFLRYLIKGNKGVAFKKTMKGTRYKSRMCVLHSRLKNTGVVITALFRADCLLILRFRKFDYLIFAGASYVNTGCVSVGQFYNF